MTDAVVVDVITATNDIASSTPQTTNTNSETPNTKSGGGGQTFRWKRFVTYAQFIILMILTHADFITDVYVLVLYAKAGGNKWTYFAISLTTLILYTIISGCIMLNTHYFEYQSKWEKPKIIALAILQMGEAADVYAIIRSEQKRDTREHKVWRLYQKILNVLVKAVPQLLLQTHALMTTLKNNGDIHAAEYASIIFSLISISFVLWSWEMDCLSQSNIFSFYSLTTIFFRFTDCISRFLLLVTFAISCGFGYMCLLLGLDYILIVILMIYTVPKSLWVDAGGKLLIFIMSPFQLFVYYSFLGPFCPTEAHESLDPPVYWVKNFIEMIVINASIIWAGNAWPTEGTLNYVYCVCITFGCSILSLPLMWLAFDSGVGYVETNMIEIQKETGKPSTDLDDLHSKIGWQFSIYPWFLKQFSFKFFVNEKEKIAYMKQFNWTRNPIPNFEPQWIKIQDLPYWEEKKLMYASNNSL